MRWERCPWGPKQEHRRHFQVGCLSSSAETDKDLFQFDETYNKVQEIKREMAGIGGQDLTEVERQAHAAQLLEFKRVYT